MNNQKVKKKLAIFYKIIRCRSQGFSADVNRATETNELRATSTTVRCVRHETTGTGTTTCTGLRLLMRTRSSPSSVK